VREQKGTHLRDGAPGIGFAKEMQIRTRLAGEYC
jgi:hypothetical protein